MKYLKKYESITEWQEIQKDKFFETKTEIKQWLDHYYIKHYTIDDNLTVHVDDDVDITSNNLHYIPFQFGRVYGDFLCQGNELMSLKGCPNYIEGEFTFYNNNLYNLNFFPENVIERNINGVRTIVDPMDLTQSDFYQNPIYSLILCLDIKNRQYRQSGKEIALFIKYLNEYDVIKYHRIYLDKLKEALYMSDVNFHFNILYNIKHYTIVE